MVNLETFKKVATDLGCVVLGIEHGGRHSKLNLEHNGKTFTYPFSTRADSRGFLNWKTQLRRKLHMPRQTTLHPEKITTMNLALDFLKRGNKISFSQRIRQYFISPTGAVGNGYTMVSQDVITQLKDAGYLQETLVTDIKTTYELTTPKAKLNGAEEQRKAAAEAAATDHEQRAQDSAVVAIEIPLTEGPTKEDIIGALQELDLATLKSFYFYGYELVMEDQEKEERKLAERREALKKLKEKVLL